MKNVSQRRGEWAEKYLFKGTYTAKFSYVLFKLNLNLPLRKYLSWDEISWNETHSLGYWENSSKHYQDLKIGCILSLSRRCDKEIEEVF